MRACDRSFAALLTASIVLLVSVGAATAGTQALTTDKGVVQSISSTSIVLRGLDGSTLTLALGPLTIVRLNGRDVGVDALRPGLVASVTHRGDRPARVVRAFGTVKVVEQGTIESVSPLELVIRRADGTAAAIALDTGTKVRRFGQPARRAALKPGRLVRVTSVPGSPARLVAVVRRLG